LIFGSGFCDQSREVRDSYAENYLRLTARNLLLVPGHSLSHKAGGRIDLGQQATHRFPVWTASKRSKDQAWDLLKSGLTEDSTDKRATAVQVLSLLTGETRAMRLACDALGDPKPLVCVAAAFALGELHARSSIPKLEAALSDKEPVVVLAAAHSLLAMKDAAAYQVYYEILTGERQGKKSLVAGELDTLRDPKKMALLGFQEGIGFVPLAGISYTAIRTMVKDDSSPVRAAARVLADDRDPDIDDALVQVAIGDKSQLVRTAALDGLARPGESMR
jgi:HEAT repeat protein